MIDLSLLIIWVIAMACSVFMNKKIWIVFVSNHPQLHQKYVPDGKWYLIPLKQFLNAIRAKEVREVFRTDSELNVFVKILFISLIVYVVLIPRMLYLIGNI
jgi:hypothetical protein